MPWMQIIEGNDEDGKISEVRTLEYPTRNEMAEALHRIAEDISPGGRPQNDIFRGAAGLSARDILNELIDRSRIENPADTETIIHLLDVREKLGKSGREKRRNFISRGFHRKNRF